MSIRPTWFFKELQDSNASNSNQTKVAYTEN